MKKHDREAFIDLVTGGFGANISAQAFSSIHGDLVIDIFNKITKSTAGPFRAGFSTNNEAANNWVQTIHIHSKVKEFFRRVLSIQSSFKHKKLTLGGRQLLSLHDNCICKWKTKKFFTGIEISPDIVEDMIKCKDIGNKQYPMLNL